jgi:hypothetical protein
MAMNEYDEFISSLESLGEEQTRLKLSQGIWANRRRKWAEDWLSQQQASRASNREEDHLHLAREANKIARAAQEDSQSAKRISIIAIVVSAAMTIIVAIIQWYGQKP